MNIGQQALVQQPTRLVVTRHHHEPSNHLLILATSPAQCPIKIQPHRNRTCLPGGLNRLQITSGVPHLRCRPNGKCGHLFNNGGVLLSQNTMTIPLLTGRRKILLFQRFLSATALPIAPLAPPIAPAVLWRRHLRLCQPGHGIGLSHCLQPLPYRIDLGFIRLPICRLTVISTSPR